VNPAAGVVAPAPGRLPTTPPRQSGTADRIPFFLRRPLAACRTNAGLVAPLAVLSLVSAAGTLAAPLLRHSPLLVVALTPRLPFLLLAARRSRFGPFMAVGTVRLCLADPFHFRLGRRLAEHGAPIKLPGASSWAARMSRNGLARPGAAAAVAVRPNGRNLALAGAVGLPAPIVVVLDVASTVVYLVALHAAATLLH
jgi:hypothetical protein